MSQPHNVLKSIDTAFEMVEHLKSEGGKTVTKLSEDLDMPKSTVQVYLNTLYKHRFVVKNGKKYEIGLRFLEYGTFAVGTVPIYPEVRSKLEELAETTGELAACFVEEEGDAVYILGVEGERSIRTDLSIGDRTDLYCTASGKAVMAHLSEEHVQDVIEGGLKERTENTITDSRELYNELSRIREQGYASSSEESVEGMRAVAAPVLIDGRITGSISLAGPASRFSGEYFNTKIPKKVQSAANELELRLTYSQSGI